MGTDWWDRAAADDEPWRFLSQVGTVAATFDASTQDSGNVSYGLIVDERRYFVKTAGNPDDLLPLFDHAQRVSLLRNAAQIASEVNHWTMPRLFGVADSAHGPMLVYEWRDGELLHARADDPESALSRFRGLPIQEICRCLDAILELHEELATAGRVAVDFYDGCLMYDFESGQLTIMDLDTYRKGPSSNDMGRMFGSSRFMAPEEFELNAPIDEITTVFTMGRTIQQLLFAASGNPGISPNLRDLWDVADRACRVDRGERYTTVERMRAAWLSARKS